MGKWHTLRNRICTYVAGVTVLCDGVDGTNKIDDCYLQV